MIEMPNPNAGAADQPPTVWVYRAWTIRDMKSVTADISHPREGPEDCKTSEWCQLAETGNALDLNNTPLSSPEDINEMYPAQ